MIFKQVSLWSLLFDLAARVRLPRAEFAHVSNVAQFFIQIFGAFCLLYLSRIYIIMYLQGKEREVNKMKATGLIRRVDDLGRIIIPKDIRRTMQIKESEQMEFFVDKDAIIIKKININSYTLRQTEDWVELLDEKGKVLVEGHSLRPEEILTALNIDFEVEEM